MRFTLAPSMPLRVARCVSRMAWSFSSDGDVSAGPVYLQRHSRAIVSKLTLPFAIAGIVRARLCYLSGCARPCEEMSRKFSTAVTAMTWLPTFRPNQLPYLIIYWAYR